MSSKSASVTLEQMIQGSDAILLVSKRDPYIVYHKVDLGTPGGGAFTFTSHRFEIYSILHSTLGNIDSLKTIEVNAASDEVNFQEDKRLAAGRGGKILLQKVYEGYENGIENLPRFLIFIRYNSNDKRFSFVAGHAMEKVERTRKIREILASSPNRSSHSPRD